MKKIVIALEVRANLLEDEGNERKLDQKSQSMNFARRFSPVYSPTELSIEGFSSPPTALGIPDSTDEETSGFDG